jgi:hypothetical protein
MGKGVSKVDELARAEARRCLVGEFLGQKKPPARPRYGLRKTEGLVLETTTYGIQFKELRRI